MSVYTVENTVVLARRHHNTKRAYLLINPLQAKHLPVSPTESLKMMSCLGDHLARTHPQGKLVIGFAETATAIGAVAASRLGGGCQYIHTTREPCQNPSDWLQFQEEHSHAVEQRLSQRNLERWISLSPELIFVDDEISTGKTLLNIVEQLRAAFPQAREREIVAASILNRLSPEHERRMAEAGIVCEYLVKMDGEDLTQAVSHFNITAPTPAPAALHTFDGIRMYTRTPLPDPRLGVDAADYQTRCQGEAAYLADTLAQPLAGDHSVLVLGTEECMYPALLLGRELERRGTYVMCHATTRSPIGVCPEADYPIRAGYQLHSFYERERETFLYNLAPCDAAVVVTDAPHHMPQAESDVAEALRLSGCAKLIIVEGGRHV